LAAELGVDVEEAPTLYVGDDTTDEDAFAVLRDHGVGVLVSDEPRRTKAHYRLRDVDEVRRFLEGLAAWREAAGS
jgi:trehalose-phosphatase